MRYPTPKRSDYKDKPYRRWLGDYEYEALKNVNAELMAAHGVSGDRLLDMACWDGKATRHYGDRLGIPGLFGLDCETDRLEEARARGVEVRICDFERDAFPFEDASFDVVVANQIFEHLKQIYRPMSEIHRVLKPGGYLLFGVPNLLGLYYRTQALLGMQPSTIKVFEAHVRAFSVPGAREFVTLNGLFEVVAFRGSGFYPLPPPLSEWLSRTFKTLGVYQVWLLRKREGSGSNWQQHVAAKDLQSNF
jgi:SAM-dependent methyltransferase